MFLFSFFSYFGVVLMELCEYGDLQHFLEQHGKALPESERIRFLSGIAQALCHLHTREPAILHRFVFILLLTSWYTGTSN